MSISCILFDLGNVLLRHNPQRRLSALAQICDKSEDDIRGFLTHGRIVNQLDLGHATATDLAAQLSDFAGKTISPDEAVRLWLTVFERNHTLWNNLRRLAPHVPLGIFSNSPLFIQRLFPVNIRFEYVFLSAQFGAIKPDIAAFHAVQSGLGWIPDQILLVDDKRDNIIQAKAIGWHGLQFMNNNQLEKDLSRLGLW